MNIQSLLNDDALAIAIAHDCHDTAHDDRWCATCEARRDGIEEYREELQRRINAERVIL